MIKKEGEGKEEEEDEGEKEDELVLREAKFTLKTNGGDCRNVLKQSLRKLFAEVLETSTSEGGGGGGSSSSSNKRSGKKSNNNSFSFKFFILFLDFRFWIGRTKEPKRSKSGSCFTRKGKGKRRSTREWSRRGKERRG